MDERVNCMACLVASESGMMPNAVATVGAVTHALARSGYGIAHHLCAWDAAGRMKDGMIEKSRVREENIVRGTDAGMLRGKDRHE